MHGKAICKPGIAEIFHKGGLPLNQLQGQPANARRVMAHDYKTQSS